MVNDEWLRFALLRNALIQIVAKGDPLKIIDYRLLTIDCILGKARADV